MTFLLLYRLREFRIFSQWSANRISIFALIPIFLKLFARSYLCGRSVCLLVMASIDEIWKIRNKIDETFIMNFWEKSLFKRFECRKFFSCLLYGRSLAFRSPSAALQGGELFKTRYEPDKLWEGAFGQDRISVFKLL